MSTSADEPPFRLLDLPTEIRRMIFREVLTGCEVHIVNPDRQRRIPKVDAVTQRNYFAVLQVCRQIRQEAYDCQFDCASVWQEINGTSYIPQVCKQNATEFTIRMESSDHLPLIISEAKPHEYQSIERVTLVYWWYTNMGDAPKPYDCAAVIKRAKQELAEGLGCTNIENVEEAIRDVFRGLQIMRDLEIFVVCYVKDDAARLYERFQIDIEGWTVLQHERRQS